jgi:plastocyanin
MNVGMTFEQNRILQKAAKLRMAIGPRRFPFARFATFCKMVWLLGIAAGVASAQSTIEGRVALPKSRVVPVLNQRYEIVASAKSGALATSPPLAVVYLEGTFPAAASPPVLQMKQKDLAFDPPLMAVQRGTRVEFPNLDDTYHNVFSYSPAKRFDLGRYRADEKPVPSQVFDVAGLVTLRCDIHEHMRALILVVDTPFFVITDPDGKFRLTDLPAGRYTLRAWVDSKTTHAQPVELTDGVPLHVEFK